MRLVAAIAVGVSFGAACAAGPTGAGASARHRSGAAAPEAASPGPDGTGAAEAACLAKLPTRCDGPAPTYEANARPVLQRACFACHAGDGAAADEHDFSKAAVALAQRKRIGAEVSTCSMPPKSRPSLAAVDAEVLLRWAACGGR